MCTNRICAMLVFQLRGETLISLALRRRKKTVILLPPVQSAGKLPHCRF